MSMGFSFGFLLFFFEIDIWFRNTWKRFVEATILCKFSITNKSTQNFPQGFFVFEIGSQSGKTKSWNYLHGNWWSLNMNLCVIDEEEDLDDQPYEYVVSKNGKNLLLLDGYSYRKYMTAKGTNKTYWLCTHRGCKAKGSVSASGTFTLSKFRHSHAADPDENATRAFISKVSVAKLACPFFGGKGIPRHKHYPSPHSQWPWRPVCSCTFGRSWP